MRGQNGLSGTDSFAPLRVFVPLSNNQVAYSLYSPRCFRISTSPNFNLRCSSLARKPKWTVLLNQTVCSNADGEQLPSWLPCHNLSTSTGVKAWPLFGFWPLPCRHRFFRFLSKTSLWAIQNWVRLPHLSQVTLEAALKGC